MEIQLILYSFACTLGAAASLGYLWACNEIQALHHVLDARDAEIAELDKALHGRGEELEALKRRGDIWQRIAREEKLRKNQVGHLLAAATGTTWVADAESEAALQEAANIGPAAHPRAALRSGDVELLMPANEWVSRASVALRN